MRYVTSIERLAREEVFEIGFKLGFELGFEIGVLQSSRENIIEVLRARFGEVPSLIVDSVNKIDDASILKTLFKRTITIPYLEELQQVLENSVSSK